MKIWLIEHERKVKRTREWLRTQRPRHVRIGRRGDKVKMDAIKAQINYRKKVLGQNFAAKSCNFSEAGKSFLLHEMSQRLKAIASLSKL